MAEILAIRDLDRVIDDRRLECRMIGDPGAVVSPLLFLHEGLGSVSLWRDFPQALCRAVGRPGLVYSRLGYGGSEPLPGPRDPRFMHDEAEGALPALIEAFGLDAPVLIGHSDGASIALIHAGRFPGKARAVVAMAPHLFVEPVCLESIAAAAAGYRKDRTGEPGFRERLARYHADVDGAFEGWADVWLSPGFVRWNIEAEVAAIRCPLLAIQGRQDQYGTMRQIHRIAELAPQAQLVELEHCQHSPHLDQPAAVIREISRFLAAST
ncbi:MAG: alpha/beta fold hydrolase [Gammaproteobacteria bacterium]